MMCVLFSSEKKKVRSEGKKCHVKVMMREKTNETLKINTQHVSLRQIVETKVRGKGLEEVWNDENG